MAHLPQLNEPIFVHYYCLKYILYSDFFSFYLIAFFWSCPHAPEEHTIFHCPVSLGPSRLSQLLLPPLSVTTIREGSDGTPVCPELIVIEDSKLRVTTLYPLGNLKTTFCGRNWWLSTQTLGLTFRNGPLHEIFLMCLLCAQACAGCQ